jgi:hypothetical protein
VLDAIIRTTCRQWNRNSTQNELRQKSEPWTPRSRAEKKKMIKKLRLFFHSSRARQNRTKIFLTSTTLGTALQRVEPDDPQHPANKRPGGHHHAHVPEKASGGATPRPPKEPGGQSRIFSPGKRSKFHGEEAIEVVMGRNCGGFGTGVGEGIGSDGPRKGREVERERDEVRSCSCFV